MTFRFKILTHRARPLYWLCWWFWLIRPANISRRVCFNNDSKYHLGGDAQNNWNKLFGISYSLSPHKNSARYGWRYNPKGNKFELAAYIYKNGVREIEPLCDLTPNWSYDCHLMQKKDSYIFRVVNKANNAQLCVVVIEKGHKKRSGYLLGSYFGGGPAAPSPITFQLKKI